MCLFLSRVIYYVNFIMDSFGRVKRSEVRSQKLKENGNGNYDTYQEFFFLGGGCWVVIFVIILINE